MMKQMSPTRPEQLSDGNWLVDGTVTIRDLNRILNWELPDDKAATIAGLILIDHVLSPLLVKIPFP